MIGEVMGLNLHNSAGVTTHTKGSGASYQLNLGAGYAVGSTSFALDTGSGTILAGDILTNSPVRPRRQQVRRRHGADLVAWS
jgi:hypothetical protein